MLADMVQKEELRVLRTNLQAAEEEGAISLA